MDTQSRNKALLETIRQGLFISSMQNTASILGDRSRYIGVSEIARYAECPRAAVSEKLGLTSSNMNRLLSMQRGHWFEEGIRSALSAAQLCHIHQLEVNIRRKCGSVKAHLDFTVVWEKPIKAVRILEVKSTERLPEEARNSHTLQVQGQVDLLRHYWNKPVFCVRDKAGNVKYENVTFPEICKMMFGLELSSRPSSISIEGWILYLSMKEAKAFGPYTYSTDSMAEIMGLADAFYQDFKDCLGDTPRLQKLNYPKGYFPLCSWCDFNADCPKFTQGSFQPQWESAISKLDNLKTQKEQIQAEITEIENALKQAHRISGTNDWIDTGAHRFRMSMCAGRKSLNRDALQDELTEIFADAKIDDVDVAALITRCEKQGASFPRLTISPVN